MICDYECRVKATVGCWVMHFGVLVVNSNFDLKPLLVLRLTPCHLLYSTVTAM